MNPGLETVEEPHPETLPKKAVGQVSADEARTAGDENAHDFRKLPLPENAEETGLRRLPPYLPEPENTAATVPSKILRSRPSDQRWMYSRSSRTHSSKSFTWFRPWTCHKQVIPGLTCNFCV